MPITGITGGFVGAIVVALLQHHQITIRIEAIVIIDIVTGTIIATNISHLNGWSYYFFY